MVLHNRKRNRLKGYDYGSNGYYFVTICVNKMEKCFGDVINRKMYLNNLGAIVSKCWEEIPIHFSNVNIDEHIVMPNHFHGIIIIRNQQNSVGNRHACSLHIGLPTLIGSFKSSTSRLIHPNKPSFRWQKSYYDHIIRSEKSLYAIRNYIKYNPYKWEEDEYMVM